MSAAIRRAFDRHMRQDDDVDPHRSVVDYEREEARSTPMREADHRWPLCQCRNCALEAAGL
jgi:hypothetical protein